MGSATSSEDKEEQRRPQPQPHQKQEHHEQDGQAPPTSLLAPVGGSDPIRMNGQARGRRAVGDVLRERACVVLCWEQDISLGNLPVDVLRLILGQFLPLPPPLMAPDYGVVSKLERVNLAQLSRHPQFMCFDREGALWVAEKWARRVVRLDASTGEILFKFDFQLPIAVGLVPRHAVLGADFAAWKSDAEGQDALDTAALDSEVMCVAESSTESVAMVDVRNGKILLHRKTFKPEAYPKGIVVDWESGTVLVSLVAPPGGRIEQLSPVNFNLLRSFSTSDSYAHDCALSLSHDRLYAGTTGGVFAHVFSTGADLGRFIGLDDISTPQGIDVDVDGNILVVDQAANKCVLVFSPDGKSVLHYVGRGLFREPCGVIVDHSSGDIFVSDENDGAVSVFRSSGRGAEEQIG